MLRSARTEKLAVCVGDSDALTPRVSANKAVCLAPKAAFDSFQGKQLMGLPFGIAVHKYRTGTLTVALVDDEEKSPFRFGNPRFRPAELIAEHFGRFHKAQPLQYSYIHLRVWIRRGVLGGTIGEGSGDIAPALRPSTRPRNVVITHSVCTSFRCVIAARAASSRSNDLCRRSRARARLF